MKSFLTSHIMISLHLIVLVIIIVTAAWYIDHQKTVMVEKVTANIERQTSVMSTLAEITDRNGADETISAIVQDCPKRDEFEALLVELSTLTSRELITVQQLFDSCGGFYAERKALMVSRLEREYDSLADNMALLLILDDTTTLDIRMSPWQTLIKLEKDRSAYLSELTAIQGDIIKTLIGKETDTTKTVQSLVETAQNLTESLAVIDKQIDALRTQLTS